MNERIQECWLKAAREDSSEKWDTQEEFIERFAREIVRECADYITEYYPHSRYEAFYMKKHFGVE